MNRWECMTCSYIYTEGWGRKMFRFIPQQTSFDALDINWKCPECGINKEGMKNEYNKRTA